MNILSAQTGIEGFKDVLTFFLAEASDNGEDAYTLAIMHDNIDGERSRFGFGWAMATGTLTLRFPFRVNQIRCISSNQTAPLRVQGSSTRLMPMVKPHLAL